MHRFKKVGSQVRILTENWHIDRLKKTLTLNIPSEVCSYIQCNNIITCQYSTIVQRPPVPEVYLNLGTSRMILTCPSIVIMSLCNTKTLIFMYRDERMGKQPPSQILTSCLASRGGSFSAKMLDSLLVRLCSFFFVFLIRIIKTYTFLSTKPASSHKTAQDREEK